jgi:hypothetical protein
MSDPHVGESHRMTLQCMEAVHVGERGRINWRRLVELIECAAGAAYLCTAITIRTYTDRCLLSFTPRWASKFQPTKTRHVDVTQDDACGCSILQAASSVLRYARVLETRRTG